MNDAEKIKKLEKDLASAREDLTSLETRFLHEESQRALADQALAQRITSLEMKCLL
ncbi:hypothetical protein P3R38_09420 [Pseudomonas sp. NyZ480]|uniref:hypothetical protein n=1 Tax=Pseudomonas sp. NyZ480 TaxID=3035289 RepID=UPI002409BA5A|nr:hypothetical protein [Pseudomonas sp. NyZ480]WEZ90460.1 hypothetical protein P3R38_09420 [Pseudomonas sp. NyZ480]